MSQARGWSAFRDGLVNLSAVDPEWVAARLAPTGVYQTWFLFRRVTILGGAAGIEAFLDPENVERASDSDFDQFKPPVGGPGGPSSLLRCGCCRTPRFRGSTRPCRASSRAWTMRRAAWQGYMRALTTANIESIFYPALVAGLEPCPDGSRKRSATASSTSSTR